MDVRVSSITYLTSIQVTKGSEEEDDDLEEDFSNEKKIRGRQQPLWKVCFSKKKKKIKGKKECLFPVEVNDEKKSALTNFEVNHIANKGIGFGLKVRIAQLCIGKAFLTYWKKVNSLILFEKDPWKSTLLHLLI